MIIMERILKKIKQIALENEWNCIKPTILFNENDSPHYQSNFTLKSNLLLLKLNEISKTHINLILIPIFIAQMDSNSYIKYTPEKINVVLSKNGNNQLDKDKLLTDIYDFHESTEKMNGFFKNYSNEVHKIFSYLNLDVDFQLVDGNIYYSLGGKKLTITLKKLIFTPTNSQFILKSEDQIFSDSSKLEKEVEDIVNFGFGFFPKMNTFFIKYDKIIDFLEYVTLRQSLIEELKSNLKNNDPGIIPDYSTMNSFFGFFIFLIGLINIGIFFIFPHLSIYDLIAADIFILFGLSFFYLNFYFKERNQFDIRKNISKIKIMEPIGLIPEPYFKTVFKIISDSFSSSTHKIQFIAEHFIFWAVNYQNLNLNNGHILITEYNRNKIQYEKMRKNNIEYSIRKIEPDLNNTGLDIEYYLINGGIFKKLISKEKSYEILDKIDYLKINEYISKKYELEDFNTVSELIIIKKMQDIRHFLLKNKITNTDFLNKFGKISEILAYLKNNNNFECNDMIYYRFRDWEYSLIENKEFTKYNIAEILKNCEILNCEIFEKEQKGQKEIMGKKSEIENNLTKNASITEKKAITTNYQHQKYSNLDEEEYISIINSKIPEKNFQEEIQDIDIGTKQIIKINEPNNKEKESDLDFLEQYIPSKKSIGAVKSRETDIYTNPSILNSKNIEIPYTNYNENKYLFENTDFFNDFLNDKLKERVK